MRWAALVPVLLAIAAVGGAISAAGEQGAPVTPAQGIAFVRAVNLLPGDLPGSVRFQGEEGSAPGAGELQRDALRCGHSGKPRGRTVAAERSVLADRDGSAIGEIVGSVVIVMPSAALAKAEIARFATRAGRACLTHGLRLGTIGSGGPRAPSYSVHVTAVPTSRTLGPGSLDLRFAARLERTGHANGRPPAKFFYSVWAIFRVGAADIVFTTLSERRRFPAATETRLLSLLHARAQAQIL